MTVTCSGWRPSTSVTITFQSDPVLLATVTTTATGTLSSSVTIPSNATTGSHSLVLVGTAANGTARTVTIPLTVTSQVSTSATPTNATSTAVPVSTGPVPVSTSNPGTLPRTGLDIGRLFTIGFILVLLGWTGIQLTRSSDSQPLWSVATERFSSALNFGGHDNKPRPSRFARVLSTLRRRRG